MYFDCWGPVNGTITLPLDIYSSTHYNVINIRINTLLFCYLHYLVWIIHITLVILFLFSFSVAMVFARYNFWFLLANFLLFSAISLNLHLYMSFWQCDNCNVYETIFKTTTPWKSVKLVVWPIRNWTILCTRSFDILKQGFYSSERFVFLKCSLNS